MGYPYYNYTHPQTRSRDLIRAAATLSLISAQNSIIFVLYVRRHRKPRESEKRSLTTLAIMAKSKSRIEAKAAKTLTDIKDTSENATNKLLAVIIELQGGKACRNSPTRFSRRKNC